MRAALILFMAIIAIGCKSVKLVPVETVRTEREFIDRWKRDSVHVRDSVFVLVKGDTVFKDRSRVVYRDRLVMDTAIVTRVDSLRVPDPVEVVKEKYRVPKSLWWLVILLAALSVPTALKIARKLKLLKV